MQISDLEEKWHLAWASWASCSFYPRDAMRRACPAVLHSRYCIKMETASVMISSPSDSPMISLSGEVWLVEKFLRGHPQRGRFVSGVGSNGNFCDFLTYMTKVTIEH